MLIKFLLLLPAVVATLLAVVRCILNDPWSSGRGKLDTIFTKIPWTVWGVIALIFWTLLLFLLVPDLVSTHYYFYFFRVLTSEGGINAWLARAFSLLFAVAVYYSLRLALSNKRHREMGWASLLVTAVAFNLFMYTCMRSMSPAEDARIIGPVGDVTTYYYVTDDGEWKLFRHPGYTPDGENYGPMGEKLKPMTPEAAREYDTWKRQKETRDRQTTAESKKQADAEAKRRFRATYVNDSVVSSSVASADRVILALKNDQPDSQGDALQGLLADLLARTGKHPVSGAFKPAFYTRGLFDELWSGDQSVLDRLHLLDDAPGSLLLCKANYSGASKTDFEGIVSVQGTLSLILVTKDGRSGPWVFRASGAGGDQATAGANCAKRLVEATDANVIFQK